MLKVLIADDNPGMRLILKKAVEKSGHQVVGEAENGLVAVEKAEKLRPALIFMDIEMAVLDGVEAAKRIQDVDPRIFIVFATAHEEYRKEAFELYAYDYMVKPFEIGRVAATLERVEALLTGVETAPALPSEAGVPKRVEKLAFKHKEGLSLITINDIILIQRENRSTVIYTSSKEKHVTSDSLSELETRLPADRFLRCHKSYIININKVSKIYPYGRWTYIVKFENTELDALMTQERYTMLQNFFR